MKNKMSDKGMAPPFKEQSQVGDGANINIDADAQGRAVNIFATKDNLVPKGEANYTGPFKAVVGSQGLLDGKAGYVNGNNAGATETDKPGVA